MRLTRWKETVPFVLPLTILGSLLAAQPHNIALDWRLVAIIIANNLAIVYAFMINEIEDAPDDARDPSRAIRNPIITGEISIRFGYNACRIVAAATLIFYAMGGWMVFGIGVATLLLSHLYSWRPVRLKAHPITDIVSHSLMLSGLLLLAGFFIYGTEPGIVWLVAAAVTLISVYGQLYNQLRDYDTDKAAGLNHTAIVLGESNARIAMYLSIALAAVCMLAAILQNVFPLWLGIVLLLSVGISMLFRPQTDMRGQKTIDATGAAQVQGLVITNITVVAWLAQVLFTQIF
jgi:4-hydroxybenzoate polyprenyltransferase